MIIKQITPNEFVAEFNGEKRPIKRTQQDIFFMDKYQIEVTQLGFNVYNYYTREHILNQEFQQEDICYNPLQSLLGQDRNKMTYQTTNQIPFKTEITKPYLPQHYNLTTENLTIPSKEQTYDGVSISYFIPPYYQE